MERNEGALAISTYHMTDSGMYWKLWHKADDNHHPDIQINTGNAEGTSPY